MFLTSDCCFKLRIIILSMYLFGDIAVRIRSWRNKSINKIFDLSLSPKPLYEHNRAEEIEFKLF